ncbi:MAG TPA: hypothetical protein VEB68_01125 [Croceibacterium sp.]|nr:hypothetical protein [Croceibacterium sp.]
MPRYFFHLHNDLDSYDDEGREMDDAVQARRCAEQDARDMAAEGVRAGELNRSHHVDVTDAGGTLLFSVRFGEVVRVVG